MTSPPPPGEPILGHQLQLLNTYYAEGIQNLNESTEENSLIDCAEKLLPLMTRIHQLERSIGLSNPIVQRLIRDSPALTEMIMQQKQLLSVLLEKVRQAESRLAVGRKLLAPEIDQQFEHQKMQSAYQQRMQF